MANRLSLSLPPISAQARTPPQSPSLPAIVSVKPPQHDPTPSSYDQESDIFDDIPLSLVLPDGITYKLVVKSGETVQEIKRKLNATHGVPYKDATLYFNGKCMIDPLSLNDFPGLVSKNGVKLDVKLNSSSGSSTQSTASSPAIAATHFTPPSPSSASSSSTPQSHPSSSQTLSSPSHTTATASQRHLPPLSPPLPPLHVPPKEPHLASTSSIPESSNKPNQTDLSPHSEASASTTATATSSNSGYGHDPLKVAGFVESAERVTSSRGQSSISFVEYTDGPLVNGTSYIQSTSFSDTHSPSLQHSPPPLPNAFSDSPAGRLRRREEPKSSSTTVIDVVDDDDDTQCKNIHELGTEGKKWKFCFLF